MLTLPFLAGFPLEKAEEYVKRVKPFCVNDLASEHVLRDRCETQPHLSLLHKAHLLAHRRLFYSLLRKNGLKVPKHVFVNRDRDPPPVRRMSPNPTAAPAAVSP